MGCDGGTIPRRDELVKVKAKTEKKDKDSELAFQWRYCHLSQQMLQSPIVMCGLGFLYNKLALIEGLLNSRVPDCVKHIKSLKNVKNLNLTVNPEYKTKDEKKEGGVDSRAAPFICPVIGMEMSGHYRFIGLWSCGCVFSERALKEISANICYKCQMPFLDDDVVILNGNEEDKSLMKLNIEKRQQKNKKEKGKKSVPATIISANVKEIVSNIPVIENKQSTSKSTLENKNTAVMGQLTLKRQKVMHSLKDRVKKVKQDYSVAEDPQASDVYKSLFTTHSSEQQQNRAHWVTYNPFYN